MPLAWEVVSATLISALRRLSGARVPQTSELVPQQRIPGIRAFPSPNQWASFHGGPSPRSLAASSLPRWSNQFCRHW
jgi:hypothetical protein